MIAWTLFRLAYAFHRACEWCDVTAERLAWHHEHYGFGGTAWRP